MNKKIFTLSLVLTSLLLGFTVFADSPLIERYEFDIFKYDFLMSLILTIVIELLVLFWITRKVFKIRIEEKSDKDLMLAGIMASFSTLPYLWFVLPLFIDSGTSYFTLVGEILVFVIETIIYYFLLKISIKKCAIISFLCNLTSFFIGLIVFNFIIK